MQATEEPKEDEDSMVKVPSAVLRAIQRIRDSQGSGRIN